MKLGEDRLGAETSFSTSWDRLGRRSEKGSRAPATLAPATATPLATLAPEARDRAARC